MFDKLAPTKVCWINKPRNLKFYAFISIQICVIMNTYFFEKYNLTFYGGVEECREVILPKSNIYY